jgi:hypothetical protein
VKTRGRGPPIGASKILKVLFLELKTYDIMISARTVNHAERETITFGDMVPYSETSTVIYWAIGVLFIPLFGSCQGEGKMQD